MPVRQNAVKTDGGAEEDRTPDLRIANATLSQLSYRPMGFDFIGSGGLMQEVNVRRRSRPADESGLQKTAPSI